MKPLLLISLLSLPCLAETRDLNSMIPKATSLNVEVMAMEYKQRQTELAPFPLYFTPLGESATSEAVEVDGKKYVIEWSKSKKVAIIKEVMPVKGDKEFTGPIVVKVSKLKYVINHLGQTWVKKILPGGEKVWDKLYNIPPPPPIPPVDDNGGGGWDKPDNSRWDQGSFALIELLLLMSFIGWGIAMYYAVAVLNLTTEVYVATAVVIILTALFFYKELRKK